MHGREAVEALHRSTRHGEPPAHADRLLPFRPLDPANRPAPFKTYTGVDPVPLPRRLRPSTPPATEVLSGRRGAGGALDGDLLGTLLFLAGGVTRVADGMGGPVWFRTAMSAGNLHPLEIYAVGDGVHHYDPRHHALVPLRREVAAGDGVVLVVTGIPFRTCWKYGERGWRHLWWDAGTMLANLLAAAAAHGVEAEVVTAFPDAAVAALIGVDGVDEVPLALVRLGPGPVALPAPEDLGPLRAASGPIAPRPLRFPLVVEAHQASGLTADAVVAWLEATGGAARPAAAEVEPPDGAPGAPIEDVILRRGSTRAFRRTTAPAPVLGWALPAATRAVPLDAAAGGTLLEHLVSVHDVEGMRPGRYRGAAGGGLEALGGDDDGDVRATSTRLCLDQALGGDSAYTAFQAADLRAVLGALGGRGYRAAHLEAGVVAGRLALAAVSLGAGATGLTFYDGLVSRAFATAAEPLLATAVGVPVTPPPPGGGPGAPRRLRRWGQVRVPLGIRRS